MGNATKKLCETCSKLLDEAADMGKPEPKPRYARRGERFCRQHRHELMKEMEWSGYLQQLPEEVKVHQHETGPVARELDRLNRHVDFYGEYPVKILF